MKLDNLCVPEAVKADWEFSNLCLPAAFDVLRANAPHLVEFEIAPLHIDLKEVGDIVLSSSIGHIAFRARRPDCPHRDLTLRCRRISGAEVEIHKIRKGFGRWYLYGWADGDGKVRKPSFTDWILVDLDELRKCGLAFEDRREWPNRDRKSWFYAYSDDELEYHGCLVAQHNRRLKEVTPASIAAPVTAIPVIRQESLFDDQVYREAQAHDLFHQFYND